MLPWLICFNLLIDTIGWSLCEPAIPFLNTDFIPEDYIGRFESFVSAIILGCSLLHGNIANKIGKTRMLQMSALFQFVGQLCLLLAVQQNSSFLYIIARFIPPIFKCATLISQSLMFDVSGSCDVTRNLGYLVAVQNFSYVCGPLVGGFYKYNPAFPFCAGMITASLNFIILLVLQGSIPSEQCHIANKLPDTNQWSWIYLRAAFQFNNILYEKTFARHAKEYISADAESVSYLISLASLLTVVAHGVLGVLVQSFSSNPNTLLLPLLVVTTLGLLGWALSVNTLQMVLSIIAVSVSANLFLSIISSSVAGIQKSLDGGASGGNLGAATSSGKSNSTKSLSDVSSIVSGVTDCDTDSTISASTTSNDLASIAKPPEMESNSFPVLNVFRFGGSASLFGTMSFLDRFIRTLAPTLYEWAIMYGGGIMGLVYLISIVSVYCATLIITTLPDRSSTIDSAESKDATLEKKFK